MRLCIQQGATAPRSPKRHRFSSPHVAASLRHQLPDARFGFAEEEAFPFSAGAFPRADESGRENFCVVKNEEVAGRKEVGQISHGAMFEHLCITANDEQPGRVPSGGRSLGDEMLGQIVIKKIGAALCGAPSVKGAATEGGPYGTGYLKFFSHFSNPFLCFSTVFSGPRSRT